MNFNNSNKTKLYNVLLLYLLFHENGIFLSLFSFSLTFSHVLLFFFFQNSILFNFFRINVRFLICLSALSTAVTTLCMQKHFIVNIFSLTHIILQYLLKITFAEEVMFLVVFAPVRVTL